MVDFFVNATTGNDLNPGTALDQAFRSITRATEVAATLPPDATGVIRVAEGVYGAPEERFTLIIPPGFDLEGAGRDLTIIRFTGRTRTIAGVGTAAWDGAALMAGNGVRNLTIEADVVPGGFSCIGIDAILLNRPGLELENVTIRARDPDRRNRFRSSTFGSFAMRATRVFCQNTGHLGGGNPSLIRSCTFENSSTGVGDGGEVVNCTFRGACSIATLAGSSAVIRDNDLLGPATWIQISSNPDDMFPPGPGPGPRVEENEISVDSLYGIRCVGPGTAQIARNRIVVNQSYTVGVLCENGATPTFTSNYIESHVVRGSAMLSVRTNAEPLFQGNTFVLEPRGSDWRAYRPISIESGADFGGGARGSLGGNDFSRYILVRIYAALPGGGTVFAQNCLWDHPFRDTWRFETSEGTTFDISGASYARS